jgi:ADYC domain/Pentapeptide repeats (8 copies)
MARVTTHPNAVMKLTLIIPCLLAGCLGTEPDPVDTGEVESWVAPLAPQGVAGQGTNMQGTNMQGTNMQGTNMQGTNMQGSSLDGATHGGAAVYDARVDGTAIYFWKKIITSKTYTWEYRSPTRICRYNQTRTQLLEPCTTYPLSNSPVVGSTWRTTFVKGTDKIPVTLRIEAVRRDPTTAMHGLFGSDYALDGEFDFEHCDNPLFCRKNTDIFNYDVKAIDVFTKNNQNPWLCPSGQTAIALAGRWEPDGTYLQGAVGFTFACTNGVIAKCTRWGYRPYDRAIRANDPNSVLMPLRGYHQTCVRAAMADYCGIGYSFTKDGTYVDIFDYEVGGMGFVPQTQTSQGHDGPVTAFGYEGWFDQRGATMLEGERYSELASSPEWAIGSVCPGRFTEKGEFEDHIRFGDRFPPYIAVKSAPMCSHSEFKTGKFLRADCSPCTAAVPSYCTDPSNPLGWDQACVNAALSSSTCTNTANRMALHSECTVGAALEPFDTGCTLQVCSSGDPTVAHCCSNGAQWDQACVAKAEQVCNGGGERRPAWGYCTPSPLPPSPLPPVGFN